ncbi:I78 family peptidase inhibitor [Pseudomonas sp. PD9R]|uniref:I78 family peptidase inhibitor n=1 Tax=Pseudomonas sp. PD9R TaxID=2853534 RepID=UPI001C43DF15|nr:I78 family peptidase inhibitor [Pseudomonas sp. PD9R]MBV6824791.1 peptidase inhibitor [Pseudomonas sp. PD9R]
MNTFLTSGLLAGLSFATLVMPAHADVTPRQCDIRYAKHLIGQPLSLAVKEQARTEANAARVVVNRHTPEFEPNRLRIFTDWDNAISNMYCG